MSLIIKSSDISSLQMQMAMLVMPAKKRKRLMWRIGNEVKKKSRGNARFKKNPDGTKWKEKKNKKGSKRMFKKLPQVIAIRASAHSAELHFKRNIGKKSKYPTGVIASMHKEGRTVRFNGTKHSSVMERNEQRKGIKKDGKATDKQAKFLVKLKMMRHYTKEEQAMQKKAKPGKQIRASKPWIKENLTYGKAQVIIASLLNELNQTSSSWGIKLPKRDFLGATPQEQTKIFERVMQGMNHGWTVKKQDITSK